MPGNVTLVSKGGDREDDGYSGFIGTELDEMLRAAGVRRLYVVGVATDDCVLHTVCDALSCGFAVFLLRDARRKRGLARMALS